MVQITLEQPDRLLIERLRSRYRLSVAIREWIRVIRAMVMREAITRFGHSRLGYLIAFIEPIVYFSGFIALRVYLKDRVPFGESAVLFLISGFITVRVFITISRRTMGAIAANQSLMTFPGVTPLDAVFARAAIEILTMGTVLVMFYGFIILSGDAVVAIDWVDFTCAILTLFALGAGVGCMNAVIVVVFPTYRHVYSFISLPLLITSGVFYVPAMLPAQVIEYIQWNPVLHCVEWIRESIYLDYVEVLDRSYPVTFAILALGLGIIMSRIFKVRLLE